MLKNFIYSITFLLVSSSLFGQKIYYSNNNIARAPDYMFNVIGKIDNNIIVWKTYWNRHAKSKVFIYDNSMNLVKTVKINILQSEEDPDPHFFITKNNFFVAYQYKHAKALIHRLAAFNANGDITSIKTLDSINARDKSISNEILYYKIVQSASGKTNCFIKMTYDAKNYVLKHSCTFINDDGLTQKSFVIPYDGGHEDLIDVTVDDNKNILFLKGTKSGSYITLKLIRQNYSDEEMLVADKIVNADGFAENSVRITETSNGYLVFGEVGRLGETDANNTPQTGLYIWQTDSVLNDFTRDVIINKQLDKNATTYTAYVSAGKNLSGVFASWNIVNPGYVINAGIESSARNSNASVFTEYPVNQVGYTSISGIYLPPFFYEKPEEEYNNIPNSHSTESFKSVGTILQPPVASGQIKLFKLNNNNEIAWSHVFIDSIDNITQAEFGKARVIAGNKAIHLIYSVVTQKGASALYHIAVNADGSFTKSFFGTWDMKYYYMLDACFLTSSNELIIPAIKGSRIKFGKMKIE